LATDISLIFSFTRGSILFSLSKIPKYFQAPGQVNGLSLAGDELWGGDNQKEINFERKFAQHPQNVREKI